MQKHSPGPPALALLSQLLTTGKGNTLIINCSGFGQHGVDPAAFQAVFNRKAVDPVTNYSIPIHVNVTFTLSAIWKYCFSRIHIFNCHRAWPGHNQFVQWNPDECRGIKKSGMATENLWLSDVFIEQSISVDQTPAGLMASMSIVKVTSNTISQWGWSASVNWTPSISPSMWRTRAWAWRRTSRSFQIHHRTSFRAGRECILLDIHQKAIKVTTATNQYEQAIFYVVIRCRHRPSPYVVNFLVPSAILVAIDILSFYLPLESRNYAPLKTTVLLGYSVFLLMMNYLLPATGTSSHASSVAPLALLQTPLPAGVYFALCLSLMVDSLLDTIFITHLLHVATTHLPPLPRWLYSLLLHCTSPGRCCPTAPQKGNKGLGLTPTHLPGVKEPEVSAGQMPGPGEAELTVGSEWTRSQREREAQKQHSVELWVQFSHVMDALLFRLYLLFMASSILTVICLWNT
uniref:5-hydroxytryptamine receptor 3D n=1 Tax=Chlorocebus sabaeus TaxID=60711 RepID=A0A0D9RM32_CHLSB